MEVEQLDIAEFLQHHPPFSKLPESAQQQIARQIEIAYYQAGTQIFTPGEPIHTLHLIRSGAVEIHRRNGDLFNRLSEGGFYGYHGLLLNRKTRFAALAMEDTLIYHLPEALVTELVDKYEVFAEALGLEDSTRLRQVISRREDANELMTSPVDKLLSRALVALPDSASVAQAALLMTAENVSSVIITPADSPQQISGIITDKDLRIRVIAEGLSVNTPVQAIMTEQLVTIEASEFVFEAMMLMLRHQVHHLPVVRKQQPIGVIALSDIIRYESQNSLFVVSRIAHADSRARLAELTQDVSACFYRMVNEDANSRMVGSAMAVIGRSFKQRLLELAEQTLGPAPIPYCLIALGSMARDEQLLVTDQDNALILDDRFDPAHHDDYFRQLADFLCDGLAECGYSYCTGKIMASNPQWRLPLREWQAKFSHWIEHPSPESLLHSAIFFDIDGVAGETRWADQLRYFVVKQAAASPRFLACMARNAMNRTPPLGFFKNFVMEKDGKHNNTINLKRRGTAPLTDLIRVHALAAQSVAQNSFDRLNDIADAGILNRSQVSDLRDALEFIASVRMRHQALDIEAQRRPDNSIEPEQMSHLEQNHLKDAFQILSNAQKYLPIRYQANRRR